MSQDKSNIAEIKEQLHSLEQGSINDLRNTEIDTKETINKLRQKQHALQLSDISTSKSYKEELNMLKALANKLHSEMKIGDKDANRIGELIGIASNVV